MNIDRPLNGSRTAPGSARTVTALLHDTASHAENVVRGEIRLALLRVHEVAERSATRYARQSIGWLVALAGAVMLMMAAVQWLSLHMPNWMATALVGAIATIIGVIIANRANPERSERS